VEASQNAILRHRRWPGSSTALTVDSRSMRHHSARTNQPLRHICFWLSCWLRAILTRRQKRGRAEPRTWRAQRPPTATKAGSWVFVAAHGPRQLGGSVLHQKLPICQKLPTVHFESCRCLKPGMITGICQQRRCGVAVPLPGTWAKACSLWRSAASAGALIESDRSPCLRASTREQEHCSGLTIERHSRHPHCTASTTHDSDTQSHTPAAMSSMFDLAGARQ
jgi:hypothetical protein